LKRAGNVFFLARSPEAPSTTIESDPFSGPLLSTDKGESFSMLDLCTHCQQSFVAILQKYQKPVSGMISIK